MTDRERVPLVSPSIVLTQDFSTVDYESQDEQDYSDLQVVWSNRMEKGKYQHSSSYKKAEVLLLCWADNSNDLATKEEVNKLKDVFETSFDFHAQIEYLDARLEKGLQVQVNAKVAVFVDSHDGPNTLLIVYYAGHGRPGSYYGSLELFGQISPNDPKSHEETRQDEQKRHVDRLVWNKTEELLKPASADVLEIFDCCHAGNLGLARGEHNSFEYLGATNEMGLTQVPGPDSFTSALIYALERLVKDKPKGRFTTVELLREIRLHAPCFPKDQAPVLLDRKDKTSGGRIMLHPIHKKGPTVPFPVGESSALDASKRQTLTLHFDFGDKPESAHLDTFGKELNAIFESHTLGVHRVRWGGIRRSMVARAAKRFQSILKPRRTIGGKRQRSENASPSQSPSSAGLPTPSSWSHRSLDSNEDSEDQSHKKKKLRT